MDCEICGESIQSLGDVIGYMTIELISIIPLKTKTHYRCRKCGSWRNKKDAKV